MTGARLMRSFYDMVTGDEDARVCKDIPDAACNDQPQNFFLHLGANVCTKIGDELASARLVLPWLLSAAGAPGFFIGLLVPIRESLALLPQLFVAAMIRKQPVRKWFWVAGSVVQAGCVMLMAVAGLATIVIGGWLQFKGESQAGAAGIVGLLLLAGAVAGVLSLAVAGWNMAGSPGLPAGLVVIGAFLVVGIAHAGVRIGRKTYLVDMATAETRATYVAVSNTAIGVVLLAGGVFGIIADWVGTAETIGLLGLICLAGAAGASRLDEVTR